MLYRLDSLEQVKSLHQDWLHDILLRGIGNFFLIQATNKWLNILVNALETLLQRLQSEEMRVKDTGSTLSSMA